jgi:hypothetical protein
MFRVACPDFESLVGAAERALVHETQPAAIETIVRNLGEADPDHPLLLLLDAKIVALITGIAQQPAAGARKSWFERQVAPAS